MAAHGRAGGGAHPAATPARRCPVRAGCARERVADRRVLGSGTRRECVQHVRGLGAVDRADGIERVYLLRPGEHLPRREHFIVAGPAGAVAKSLPSFPSWWEEVEHKQLDLLANAV